MEEATRYWAGIISIYDPLEEDKRASDYHRLANAEAQPEADAFCGCEVPV
jgi:hypothetical protein